MATDHDDDLDREDGQALPEGDTDTQHNDEAGDARTDLDDDAEGAGEGAGDDEGDDEIVIGFEGGEPAARSEDSPVIRKVREENRRLARELAEMRKRAEPAPVALGPRPTLESCEYDEEKFATEHEAWLGRKATADAEQAQRRKAQQDEQQAWQDELAGFERKKAALKIKNFAELEEAVTSGLSQAQQAIIIMAADDSAKVIAALGMHPQKLADLAKIDNPVKFTAAVAKLEGSLKVTTRRQAPNPDRSVRGSAPFSAVNGKVDKHLEKLEREADRTNDRSAVVAYKRELREKANSSPRR